MLRRNSREALPLQTALSPLSACPANTQSPFSLSPWPSLQLQRILDWTRSHSG